MKITQVVSRRQTLKAPNRHLRRRPRRPQLAVLDQRFLVTRIHLRAQMVAEVTCATNWKPETEIQILLFRSNRPAAIWADTRQEVEPHITMTKET